MNKLIAIPSLFCALALPAVKAAAESQIFNHNTGYVNELEETSKALQSIEERQMGYVRPRAVFVSLVRVPGMDENQVALRLSVKENIQGCFAVTPLDYELGLQDKGAGYMDIEIGPYQRSVDRDCRNESRDPSATIPLDRQTLEDVRHIRFKSEFVTDRYDVTLTGDTLTLVADSMFVFKPKGDLLFDFLPENTVALTAPMAQNSGKIRNALIALGRSRGLARRDSANGKLLFIDESGSISRQLSTGGEVEIGTVAETRLFDGLNGLEKKSVPLQVYAVRP